MKARLVAGAGLLLGLVGALAALAVRFPAAGAQVSWHLHSMVEPAGAPSREMQ